VSVEDLRPPSWTSDPQLWQQAFEVAARPWPPFPPKLVHRDYHEGNTLFTERRLTGIIDWTTACSGPAAIDLAHMRMNLTWAFDPEVGDEYLARWGTVGDPAAWHPHWEVLEAIDWIGDGEVRPDHTPERLARFEAYIRRALADAG
jgi:aminoglycoside phosphotransferase (APT) family kinase protein